MKARHHEQVLAVLACKLTDHAKLYLIALCAGADADGVGAQGQKKLAEQCSISPKTCTRAKGELDGPASPVDVRWRSRELPDGTPIPDEYRITWRTPRGQSVAYPPGDSLSGTPKKREKRVRDSLSGTVTESPFIKGSRKAENPIEEKQKTQTSRLGPAVAKEGEGNGVCDVTLFVPGPEHRELIAELGYGAAEVLRGFTEIHTSRRTLATPQKWPEMYLGYIENRKRALLRQKARRGARASEATQKGHGVTATAAPAPMPAQALPLSECEIDPSKWAAVLKAIPKLVDGDNLADHVIREMHDLESVKQLVADALGASPSVTWDAGHEQAVRRFCERLHTTAA